MKPTAADFLDRFLMAPSFSAGPRKHVIGELAAWASQGRPRYHVSINALSLYWARRCREFCEALQGSSLATPDGASLAILARLMGRPIQETMPGIDLACELLEIGVERGWTFVFVGPHERALALAHDKLRTQYPGLKGERLVWIPGKDFASCLGALVRRSKANAVFAGLPMPVQELWLKRYRQVIGCGLMMGLGGSFEVWAGLAARAPEHWRRLKLEWLYRFAQEPRRRWRPVLRSFSETALLSGELGYSKLTTSCLNAYNCVSGT